jgi:hypothetical protein
MPDAPDGPDVRSAGGGRLAAFFGAAGLLAGQATGVQTKGAVTPLTAASTSGPDVASVPGAPTSTSAAGSPGPTTATTAATLPPLGTKVAIVGDSLTDGIKTRITPFAARLGFDAKIDAQTGRDIEAGLSPLKKIDRPRPRGGGPRDERRPLRLTLGRGRHRIDEMMALASASRCRG